MMTVRAMVDRVINLVAWFDSEAERTGFVMA